MIKVVATVLCISTSDVTKCAQVDYLHLQLVKRLAHCRNIYSSSLTLAMWKNIISRV